MKQICDVMSIALQALEKNAKCIEISSPVIHISPKLFSKQLKKLFFHFIKILYNHLHYFVQGLKGQKINFYNHNLTGIFIHGYSIKEVRF